MEHLDGRTTKGKAPNVIAGNPEGPANSGRHPSGATTPKMTKPSAELAEGFVGVY